MDARYGFTMSRLQKAALPGAVRTVARGIGAIVVAVVCSGAGSGCGSQETDHGVSPQSDAGGSASGTDGADGPGYVASDGSGGRVDEGASDALSESSGRNGEIDGAQDAGQDGGGQGTGGEGGGQDAQMADGGGQGAGAEASLPALVLLYHFSTTTIPTPTQAAFYKNVLAGWGYGSEDSVDPGKFTDVNLSRYAAVVMNNTCFWPFGQNKDGSPEAMALQRFLARGGGLFGTHCASVTDAAVTKLYRDLLGGHGGNGNFDGASSCRKIGDHPTITQLPAQFGFTGNLDNTDFIAPTTTVSVMCKWGGGAMLDVAVSWYRTEGAGRVFYTNFGKVDSDLTDPVLGGKHIVPGLSWVLRRN